MEIQPEQEMVKPIRCKDTELYKKYDKHFVNPFENNIFASVKEVGKQETPLPFLFIIIRVRCQESRYKMFESHSCVWT